MAPKQVIDGCSHQVPRQDPTDQLSLRRLQLSTPLKFSKSYTAKGLMPLQAEGTATMASSGAKHQHDPNVGQSIGTHVPTPAPPLVLASLGTALTTVRRTCWEDLPPALTIGQAICSRSLNQRYLGFPALLHNFAGKINPMRKFRIWSLSCASTHGLAHPAHPIVS